MYTKEYSADPPTPTWILTPKLLKLRTLPSTMCRLYLPGRSTTPSGLERSGGAQMMPALVAKVPTCC